MSDGRVTICHERTRPIAKATTEHPDTKSTTETNATTADPKLTMGASKKERALETDMVRSNYSKASLPGRSSATTTHD